MKLDTYPYTIKSLITHIILSIKNINIKLFLIIFIAFSTLGAIGTLSHEMGHIIVAKLLGYRTNLSYSSIRANGKPEKNSIYEIYYTQYSLLLEEGLNKKQIEKRIFDDNEEIFNLFTKYNKEADMVTLGGPSQTTLTGSIGFLLLIFLRRKNKKFGIGSWIAVIMSLFWLQEIYSFSLFYLSKIIGLKEIYGDELKLADSWDLPHFSISFTLCIIGLIVCWITVFRLMPHDLRKYLILAGSIGSIIGFIIWMYWLGPVILP